MFYFFQLLTIGSRHVTAAAQCGHPSDHHTQENKHVGDSLDCYTVGLEILKAVDLHIFIMKLIKLEKCRIQTIKQ